MKKTKMNIQLFAEGVGTGTGAGDEAGTEQAVTTDFANQDSGVTTHAADGIETGQDATEVTTKELEDRKANFEQMIKGEYGDLFNERVKGIIEKRLAGHDEVVEKLTKTQPILDILANKYGLSDTEDIDKIVNAIEEDDALYAEEASDRGMTVEELKRVKKLERENAALKETAKQISEKQQEQEFFENISRQAEALKETYPNFDLNTESENYDFVNLIKKGVDVKTAFEVLHKDEILQGAMQYTAKQVAQKVANSVQSRANRPMENGVSSQAAVTKSFDVSKMTKQQREDLEKRAMKGEKIKL